MVSFNGKKYYRICDDTLTNYSEMLKRLKRRKNITTTIVIYYSVFLIIFPLFMEYFPKFFNANLVNFIDICLSICILACSLVIQNVKYPERIAKVTDAVNFLKCLKREMPDCDGQELINKIKKYSEFTNHLEPRDEIDFFHSVKIRCKKYNIHLYLRKSFPPPDNMKDDDKEKFIAGQKATINHLSALNIPCLTMKNLIEYVIYGVAFLFPVICFIISILYR